jgi:hypothetical protein
MDLQKLKSDVLAMIEKSGPLLPIKICKELNITTIFAGALLSDLSSTKKIKVSNTKIGGSPVYYAPGQESKLDMLYSKLKDPEKNIYDLLKGEKILEDSSLNPLQRVAIREIKDFAIKLDLTNGSIFWKWHLTLDDEAESLIRSKLNANKPKEVQSTITEQPKEEVKEEFKETPQEELKKEEKIEEKIEEVKEEPKEIKEKPKKSTKKKYDLTEIIHNLEEKEIKVSAEETIKKNSEYNLLVDIKSSIGKIKFLAKFSAKKTVSDKDLIVAQHEAQSKKLPLLYITPGRATKKGEKYAESNNILIFYYG